MPSVVYWIHYPEEKDVSTQGYVGVSTNLNKRVKMHKTGHGNIIVERCFKKREDIIVAVIYEGTEDECYNREKLLRPIPRIGWNIAEGGSKPPSPLGDKERSRKTSESLKGRIITWGDKISENRKGKSGSPESYVKMAQTKKERGVTAWNKGLKTGPQSQATINKRKKSLEGKHACKSVKTPLGIFVSISEAARAHNVGLSTMHARIKYYKMDGYEYN